MPPCTHERKKFPKANVKSWIIGGALCVRARIHWYMGNTQLKIGEIVCEVKRAIQLLCQFKGAKRKPVERNFLMSCSAQQDGPNLMEVFERFSAHVPMAKMGLQFPEVFQLWQASKKFETHIRTCNTNQLEVFLARPINGNSIMLGNSYCRWATTIWRVVIGE